MGTKGKSRCICCRLVYDGRIPLPSTHAVADISGDGMEMGLNELVHYLQQQPEQPQRLKAAVARHVAGFAKARARETMHACRHLSDQGQPDEQENSQKGQQKGQQKGDERTELEPPLAPFDVEEIEVGRLLGIGGFSTVFEIKGFKPNQNFSNSSRSLSSRFSMNTSRERLYSARQMAAREFLTQHAQRREDMCKEDAESQSLGSFKAGALIDEEDEEVEESNSTMSRYAIKHLRPGLLSSPEKFAKAAMDLSCEAEMMRILDHPHIVKLRGCAAGGPGAYKYGYHNSFFLIVDRLVETLEERIWEWRCQWKQERNRKVKSLVHWAKKRLFGVRKTVLDVRREDALNDTPCNRLHEPVDYLLVERLKVAYNVSSALEYLHDRRIIYRDLKSSNIGFDFRGDVRIFDFGLSRFLPSSTENFEDSFRMSNVGTRRYTAPEVAMKKPYNLKADVFSFGVVLWEIMSLNSPRTSKRRDRSRQRDLKSCPCWPTDLQQLIHDMISDNPQDRPTIKVVRAILKELLVEVSDQQTSSEFLNETNVVRRRSTFKLEAINFNSDELKRLAGDSERLDQSHTSIDTSFTSCV